MSADAPAGNGAPPPKKPSLLAQAAKALSQLALTFYVLLLLTVLLATSGSHPIFAIMMAALAGIPVFCGPGAYRLVGLAALAIAGALYLTSKQPPKRPGAQAPQPAIVAAADGRYFAGITGSSRQAGRSGPMCNVTSPPNTAAGRSRGSSWRKGPTPVNSAFRLPRPGAAPPGYS